MRPKPFGPAALLLLALSARSLAAAPTLSDASCPDYGPLPGAPADYASAVATFAQYRASKEPGIRAEGDLPFLRTHGGPTAGAVLLVHGLTDSPYYVAAIGDALYAKGYNVVAVLLPGHGTAPECLLHVTRQQWQTEVRFGLSVARRLGGKVSMVGFSTGGALALDAIAANYATSDRDPIAWGNLLLFSPAIGFDNWKLDLCDVPVASDVIEKIMPWAQNNPDAPETNPYKYVKMATNAACQLYYLTQGNSRLDGAVDADVKARGVGVFAVESMADTTVSPEAVVKFMGALPAGVHQQLITYPKSENIAHADVPRPETNPEYPQMISALDAFVAAPALLASEPPLPPVPSSEAILLRAGAMAGALAR
jgi:esterase/lipase